MRRAYDGWTNSSIKLRRGAFRAPRRLGDRFPGSHHVDGYDLVDDLVSSMT